MSASSSREILALGRAVAAGERPLPSARTAWLDALVEPAWLVGLADGCITEANPAALRLLGVPGGAADVIGSPCLQWLAGLEDMLWWQALAQAAGQGEAADCEPLHSQAWLMLGDGSGRMVERRASVLPADEGEAAPGRVLVSLRDLSAERAESDAREAELAELRSTLEATADGILVTDLGGRIRAFNHRFAEIWGLPEALVQQPDDGAILAHMAGAVAERAQYARRLAALAQATLAHDVERLHLAGGRVVERVSRPQLRAGQVTGRVWSFRDLTEIVSAQHRIEALSSTDTLTGLLNRRQLAVTLVEATRQARQRGRALALLMLDLDRFREVNESFGQQVGDRVLQEAADRLRRSVRHGDLVARLGGDQFAVLVQGADARGAEIAAERTLATMAEPMSVDEVPFTLTCSIGVALFPDDGEDGERLLGHAEQAMREAKRSGRGCHQRAARQLTADDQRGRIQLDHAMRQALAAERFRLHYQPQVLLATGAVIGAEALLRWWDPQLGEVSPGRFIPVAEDTGFIVQLGDWVLREAIRQAAEWQSQGIVMPVSVNVSALQFQQPGFVDRVGALLRQHGLSAEMLELELTESVLVQGVDEALRRLGDLAATGVRLAIDDFGTGYSSLSYLKRFPIHRLKIDRGFLKGVPGAGEDEALVRAIVQMGKALGMSVIAEGVETAVQRDFLRDVGCDEFQGWLFAPALAVESFLTMLKAQALTDRSPEGCDTYSI